MTIPSRLEAARLLRSLAPPAWYLGHACAVADVASWLALRAAANGRAVNRSLVDAAALLHDVDKLPAAGAPAGLRHGEGSAAWLEAGGWAELAAVVRDHPVTRLADPAYEAWSRTASLEARIVAYADKRAGQRLEPMDERFASWRRRYPSGPGEQITRGTAVPSATATAGTATAGTATAGTATAGTATAGTATRPPTGSGWDDDAAALVETRARELERDVCAAAAVSPADVRRLRWSRRALRESAR
ncbi:MAG: HD domain-containing protein [Candidatus Limnocylindrales bacterium]